MTADLPPPGLAGLGQLASRLNQIAEDLQACQRTVAAAAEGRHFDAAAMLARTPGLMGRIGPALRDAAALIEATPVAPTIEAAARRAQLHYRETLERTLDAAGLARAGQWPSYTLGGVLRLGIDLSRGDASLEGKRLGTMEPARVVERAALRLADLLGGPFDPDDFLATLLTAHREAGATTAPDAYVDIRAVHSRLRTTIAASAGRYPEAQFAADLYRLLRGGRRPTADGLTIDLSPAPSAGSGLFVPAAGGGNYVGAIRFVRRPTGG